MSLLGITYCEKFQNCQRAMLWVSTETYRCADFKYGLHFNLCLSETKPEAKMSFFTTFGTGNATEELEVSMKGYWHADFKYGLCLKNKKIKMFKTIFLQMPYLKSQHWYASVDTSNFSIALPVSKLAKNTILASGLVCDKQKLKWRPYLESVPQYASVDTSKSSVALPVPKLPKIIQNVWLSFLEFQKETCKQFWQLWNQ